jgi:hypothetical protein
MTTLVGILIIQCFGGAARKTLHDTKSLVENPEFRSFVMLPVTVCRIQKI